MSKSITIYEMTMPELVQCFLPIVAAERHQTVQIISDFTGPLRKVKRYGFLRGHGRDFQESIYNLIGEFAGSNVRDNSRNKLLFRVNKNDTLGQIRIHNTGTFYNWDDSHPLRSNNWVELRSTQTSDAVENLREARRVCIRLKLSTVHVDLAIEELSAEILVNYQLVFMAPWRSVSWVK